MSRREASIDDLAIAEAARRIHGPRPEAEHGADVPAVGRYQSHPAGAP